MNHRHKRGRYRPQTYPAAGLTSFRRLVHRTSFLPSNLTLDQVRKLPDDCKGDSLNSSVWRTYARKQQCENHPKDLLSDVGMHHPSSARTCVNQVLYEIAAIALTIGVFISRALLPEPFHNARLWPIARSLYNIPATLSCSGRTLVLRLSTAPIAAIQSTWATAMQKLATL